MHFRRQGPDIRVGRVTQHGVDRVCPRTLLCEVQQLTGIRFTPQCFEQRDKRRQAIEEKKFGRDAT